MSEYAQFQQKTSELAIKYVDHFLCMFQLPDQNLQLLGVVALFVSSKVPYHFIS